MKNKETKYWAELVVNTDGMVKVKIAKKLQDVNQYVRHWKRVSARGLARKLNRSKLVIK